MKPPKALLATPEATEHAFYEALDHADLDGLMSLWADNEEISCIHPSGPRLQGHNLIRASFAEVFANGAVHIRPSHVHVVQGSLVTVHNLIENILVQSPDGQKLVQVFATNVFHKTEKGWRLVLHHASPPVLNNEGKPQTEALPTVLH